MNNLDKYFDGEFFDGVTEGDINYITRKGKRYRCIGYVLIHGNRYERYRSIDGDEIDIPI